MKVFKMKYIYRIIFAPIMFMSLLATALLFIVNLLRYGEILQADDLPKWALAIERWCIPIIKKMK